jgi:hypothetical protein
MRSLIAFALPLTLALGPAPAAEPKTVFVPFARADLGQLPADWKAEKTGSGAGSAWKLVRDETDPAKDIVLAQTAAGPNALFNLCVYQKVSCKDVELRVAFKAVKGENDQGGGFVWRYQDADNYYVARMNPLEDNYRFYKVVAGKRTQLATKEGLKVPAGTWHTLAVRMAGDRVECLLDNKKQLEAKDDTFTKPGKVGLWTKADAQTYFANFMVRDLDQ